MFWLIARRKQKRAHSFAEQRGDHAQQIPVHIALCAFFVSPLWSPNPQSTSLLSLIFLLEVVNVLRAQINICTQKGLWIGHYFWLALYILTVSVCSVIWSQKVCKVQRPQKCSKVQLVCTLVNRVSFLIHTFLLILPFHSRPHFLLTLLNVWSLLNLYRLSSTLLS